VPVSAGLSQAPGPMVAYDQDSITNPVLTPRIIVGVLNHDCPTIRAGSGPRSHRESACDTNTIRRLVIRYGDLIGALAPSG